MPRSQATEIQCWGINVEEKKEEEEEEEEKEEEEKS